MTVTPGIVAVRARIEQEMRRSKEVGASVIREHEETEREALEELAADLLAVLLGCSESTLAQLRALLAGGESAP